MQFVVHHLFPLLNSHDSALVPLRAYLQRVQYHLFLRLYLIELINKYSAPKLECKVTTVVSRVTSHLTGGSVNLAILVTLMCIFFLDKEEVLPIICRTRTRMSTIQPTWLLELLNFPLQSFDLPQVIIAHYRRFFGTLM